MKIIFFLLFIAVFLSANIDTLLGELAQKDDLSEETKKESAGYLTVYTRADLDQMKIRNLKELIVQIPFLRYKETRAGFSDPLYSPYQPSEKTGIKVYIDDRELISPYNGNGLLLFGQVSLDYIDHIEIYMGIPSQTFGLQPSLATIKCYSKDPKREQTSVVGANYGSHGLNKQYGYTAQTYKGYEYLIALSREENNVQKIQHINSDLSRDKEIYNLQAKVQKDNFKLDLELAHSNIDTFMGASYDIDPINPHIDVNNMYIGFYYDNKLSGFKSSISYAHDDVKSYDNSMSILGVYQIPIFPFYSTYSTSYAHMTEKLYNAKIFKSFKTQRNSLLLGVQGRVKQFDLKELRYGSEVIPKALGYDTESILSLSAEDSYLLNESNILTLSVIHNKYNENSDVKNYDTTSGRVGYIYNNNSIISKSFIFVGESIPDMKVLYNNRAFMGQVTDPEKSKQLVYSTKITYKSKRFENSLLYGHTILENSLYFDGVKYANAKSEYILDSFSYRFSYALDPLNRILMNAWMNKKNNKNLSTDQKSTTYGGYITLFNTLGKFDFYNNLVYTKWDTVLEDGYNFNSTVTYNYSRKLNLYLKANNLFGTALKNNYYSVNPTTGDTSYLNNVDVNEQIVLVGVEYQF